VEPVRFTRLDVPAQRITINPIMKRLGTTFAFVVMLAGCATQSPSHHLTSNRQLPDGTVVDYAGVPCRNQNMHVKPLCLFPHTLHASGTRDVGV
jgi:hypothetical protein